MKVFDQNQFFAGLNLPNLTQSEKEKIWLKFLDLVSLEILDNILDELTNKEQEELFSNLARKPQAVNEFLEKNPKVRKLTKIAVVKMKKEVLKNFYKR